MSRLTKLVGILSVAVLVLWPVVASAQDPCAGLTARRTQVQRALERIEAQKLPEERLEDLNIVLVELIDFLNANVKDSGEVQEKIKEIQERIPESDRPMIQKANEFLTGVSGGLGNIADRQKKAAEFLTGMQEKLNTIQSFVQAGNEVTARRQIEEFANFFDGMRKIIPGIDQIPGLSDMFQAYSDGIRGIAISAGAIDQIVSRNNQAYRDAGLGDALYLRARTPREKRAELIQNLSQQLDTIDQEMLDANCGQGSKTPPPQLSAEERICYSRCSNLYIAWLQADREMWRATFRADDLERDLPHAQREFDSARENRQVLRARKAAAEKNLADFRAFLKQKNVTEAQFPNEMIERTSNLRDVTSRLSVAENAANRLGQEFATAERLATDARTRANSLAAQEATAKAAYFECARGCWDTARSATPSVKVPADVVEWEKTHPQTGRGATTGTTTTTGGGTGTPTPGAGRGGSGTGSTSSGGSSGTPSRRPTPTESGAKPQPPDTTIK
jgi:uncharacterized phage infection (PIP) family protein YhgE